MKQPISHSRLQILLLFFFALNFNVFAQEEPEKSGSSAQELADKLANPVATLISVPLQNNLTYGIGPYNGSKYQINIQPVIPFKLSDNLNLITRYILPVVDQQDVTGENKHEFGLSDATVTAFFAPKTKGIILGFGPAFLVPTATETFLGTEKFGIGPSVLVCTKEKDFPLVSLPIRYGLWPEMKTGLILINFIPKYF